MSHKSLPLIPLAVLALLAGVNVGMAQDGYKQRIGQANPYTGKTTVRYYEMPQDESSLKIKLEEFKTREQEALDYLTKAKAWLAQNEASASQENLKKIKADMTIAEYSILNAKLNQAAVGEQLKMIRSRGPAQPRGGGENQRPIASSFENTKWQMPNFETLWLKRNGRWESYDGGDGPGRNSNDRGNWSQTGNVITLRKDGTSSGRTLTIDGNRLKSENRYLPKIVGENLQSGVRHLEQ
jgi:hypothetical protein